MARSGTRSKDKAATLAQAAPQAVEAAAPSPLKVVGQKGASKKQGAKGTAKAGQLQVPINTIVEQWHRERPDLDPEPMRLFGALAQAHLLTTPYMNNVLERHGLVRGTFDVLSALRRAGPPYSLTPKQLAESLLLSGAGMTNRLDRLESLNLIARLPEPNDRRSLKIQLTQKGVKLVDEIIPKFVEAQHRLVSRLGIAETEILLGLLDRLSAALLDDIGSGPKA
jgi:DNA-binding MarR family transcriptional regulator